MKRYSISWMSMWTWSNDLTKKMYSLKHSQVETATVDSSNLKGWLDQGRKSTSWKFMYMTVT